MMATSTFSYDWVREIKPSLKQLDAIPLTGNAPPFPWKDFSQRLSQAFDRQDIKIIPGEIGWRAKEDLYEGLGASPLPLRISIPSIKGEVCWLISQEEIPLLAALLLTKETHPLPLHDPAFTESFYRFATLEILYHLGEILSPQSLSPALSIQTMGPDEDALCWDISIHLESHQTFGRLVISSQFRQSWVEHFAKKNTRSPLSQQMTQTLNVTAHLEIGKTQMNLAKWMSIKLGDFLIIDSCSLNPENFEGRILLTVNGKPSYRAKLKEGKLKILELPLFHEVETSMAKQPQEESDFSDDNETDENSFSDEVDENEDLFSDTGEDLFDDDAEEVETLEETEQEPPKETKDPSVSKNEGTLEPKTVISSENIPVTIVVEMGQIQIKMDQLLKLEPGNLLNIDLHPQNGVDLTLNGQIVAKGELIRIGDAIGVRIMELGHT